MEALSGDRPERAATHGARAGDPLRRTRADHRAGHPDGLPQAHAPRRRAASTLGPRRARPQDRASVRLRPSSATRRASVIGESVDSPSDFGRIAAFAAKQVINQRLRDIGDDKVLGQFKGSEGDIVAGVIQQGPNPRMVHVDLGTVEAILPPEEQVPGENYAHGTRIRVYVTERRSRARRGRRSPCRGPTRRWSASSSPSRSPRSPAASSRSSRWPARPGTAPRWPSVRPSPASTPRARASASSVPARACGHDRARTTRRSTSSTTRSDLPTFVASALSPAKVSSAFVIDAVDQGRPGPRARLPAVARDRQGGAERPPRREAHGRADRHPAGLDPRRRRLSATTDIDGDPVRSWRQASGVPDPGRRSQGVEWNPSERASVLERALRGPHSCGSSPETDAVVGSDGTSGPGCVVDTDRSTRTSRP